MKRKATKFFTDQEKEMMDIADIFRSTRTMTEGRLINFIGINKNYEYEVWLEPREGDEK